MKRVDRRGKRATKIRAHQKRLGMVRVCVHKTNVHIYAQLIAPNGDVLAAASTVSKEYRDSKHDHSKVDAADWVGTEIAKKAIATGNKSVAFDRSGFKYHGRIKKLAEAARAAGLEF